MRTINITRPAHIAFLENVQIVQEGHKTYYWIKNNKPKQCFEQGTDIQTFVNGEISITPPNALSGNQFSMQPFQNLVGQPHDAFNL